MGIPSGSIPTDARAWSVINRNLPHCSFSFSLAFVALPLSQFLARQTRRPISRSHLFIGKTSCIAVPSRFLFRCDRKYSTCAARKKAHVLSFGIGAFPITSFASFQSQQHRTQVPGPVRRPYCRTIRNTMVQGIIIDDDGCIVDCNPATGQVLDRVPCTTLFEIETMVQQATAAQLSWAAMSVKERITALRSSMEALTAQQTSLTELIVHEMGKPLAQAREEIECATGRKYDTLGRLERVLQPVTHGRNSLVVRQPIGVVLVLSPWNFPVDEILLLVLPALASGNAVICKPSEVTPLCGAAVIHALQCGLPESVLQLAQGDGPNVGAPLVEHTGIHMIAMTGSTATGHAILQKSIAVAAPAGETSGSGGGHITGSTTTTTAPVALGTVPSWKRVVLELGGKDPMIVMADADLHKAAHDAVYYSLFNTGQVCCSIERIYVADAVYGDFAQAVTQEAQQYPVGNGMDPTSRVGPLVSARQRDLVHAQVQDALEKGATLLYQSSNIPDVGHFFPVTVLSNVTDNMLIAQAETFGPVVCIMEPFDGSVEIAIHLANHSPYGLASSVYSQNPGQARAVAMGIHAGQVGINCYAIEHMHPACPWVGHKSSGYNYHSGDQGFLQFSLPKSIVQADVAAGDADGAYQSSTENDP